MERITMKIKKPIIHGMERDDWEMIQAPTYEEEEDE